ncbi:hypothetical protein HOLleu_14146 [Holothuria leucospilota]|uniref:Uncharacterized protein n=1 Tax=Holothuria leucospilota TaxID=206669 RepID=A0A9Q1C789_HOLLE|nr:hypothetical protein HOLleu_14146 [Holothuria leucospilota]
MFDTVNTVMSQLNVKGSPASRDQLKQLESEIERNFDAFSKDNKDLGHTTGVKHGIPPKDNTPFKKRVRNPIHRKKTYRPGDVAIMEQTIILETAKLHEEKLRKAGGKKEESTEGERLEDHAILATPTTDSEVSG